MNKFFFTVFFLLILVGFFPFLLKKDVFYSFLNKQHAQVFSSTAVPVFSPIEIEAETGTLISPFQAKDGYIYTSVRNSGSATFKFNIANEDNYILRVFVDAPVDYSYIAVSMDGGSTATNYFIKGSISEPTTGFDWRNLLWVPSQNNQIKLTPGEHTLVISNSYANVKIDKIQVTRLIDVMYPQITSSVDIENNVAVMNNGLKLEKQDVSSCYLNGSSYICGIRNGLLKFQAVIKLPRILTPGDYFVFVKGNSAGLELGTFDQSTLKVVPNSSDKDGFWTSLGHLKINNKTDKVFVNFHKKGLLTSIELSSIDGIYITKDPKEYLTSTDLVLKDVVSDPSSGSEIAKGNLVSNGSFEVGVMSDWVLIDRYDVSTNRVLFIPFFSLLDTTVGAEGGNSLKISPNRGDGSIYQFLYSKVYRLMSGKKYSLSLKAKALSSPFPRVTISLVNVGDPNNKIEKSVFLTNSWQDINVTGIASGNPSDYKIKIFITGGSNSPVWLDAIQLEEGDPTLYQSANEIEAGVSFQSNPGHIFYEDELIKGVLSLKNNSNQSVSKNINYEIYDNLNKLIESNSLVINLSPNQVKSQDFYPSVNSRGIFRIFYWVENDENSEKEITFSILPRPVSGDTEKSFMGIHGVISDFQLPILKKLGIHWLRTLSTADFIRWAVVEPSDDNFIWYDEQFAKAQQYGFHVLGTLGAFYPNWAKDSQGDPNIEKWQDYVAKTVDHYKNYIKYWEIDNEPNYEIPALHYAKMLKTASDAIESSDPNAKIVAMGGVSYGYLQFIRDVVSNLKSLYPDWNLSEHADYISMHAYSSGTGVPSAKTNIYDVYGVPVWNTETGAWDSGFFLGDFSGFYSLGRQTYPFKSSEQYYRGSLKRPEIVLQNFLSSIGGGHSKYFYYDSRVTDQPFNTQPTIIENDDSIKSKGIAYAIAGYFIDYSDILGAINLNPNVNSFLFGRNGVPTLVIWSKDLKNRILSTSLNASEFGVYDMMGNVIPSSSSINFGRTPIYVVGRGITIDDFKNILLSGSVSLRGDVIAPNVVVASAPREISRNKNIRIRWFGADETSSPEIGDLDPEQTEPLPGANPNAILYSYRLRGLNDNWSSWTPDTYYDYSNLVEGIYTFEVKAKDEAGNISDVTSRMFRVGQPQDIPVPPTPITTTPTTPTMPTAPTSPGNGGGGGGPILSSDTVPPQISSVGNSLVKSDSSVINWQTNELANSQVEYGLTNSYGSLSSLDSGLVNNHSVTLVGLQLNTTYHYRVVSSDVNGNRAVSQDFTFTTTSSADAVVRNEISQTVLSTPPSYPINFKGTGNLSMKLFGNNPSYIKKGSYFIDPGVSISGSRDDLFKIKATVNGKDVGTINDVDISNLPVGEHSVIYTVKDSDGYVVTAERKLIINSTGTYERPPVSSAGSTGSSTVVIKPSVNNPGNNFATNYIFTRVLKRGQKGEDVKQLQKFLNDNGFTVSTSGPGSKGNETLLFGSATYKALVRFQEAYSSEILIPSGLNKGTGYFGNATMKKVNAFKK